MMSSITTGPFTILGPKHHQEIVYVVPKRRSTNLEVPNCERIGRDLNEQNGQASSIRDDTMYISITIFLSDVCVTGTIWR